MADGNKTSVIVSVMMEEIQIVEGCVAKNILLLERIHVLVEALQEWEWFATNGGDMSIHDLEILTRLWQRTHIITHVQFENILAMHIHRKLSCRPAILVALVRIEPKFHQHLGLFHVATNRCDMSRCPPKAWMNAEIDIVLVDLHHHRLSNLHNNIQHIHTTVEVSVLYLVVVSNTFLLDMNGFQFS